MSNRSNPTQKQKNSIASYEDNKFNTPPKRTIPRDSSPGKKPVCDDIHAITPKNLIT